MLGRLIAALLLAGSIGVACAAALAESIVDTGVIEGVVRDALGQPIQTSRSRLRATPHTRARPRTMKAASSCACPLVPGT